MAKYSSGVGKIQKWGLENTVVGLRKYCSGVGKILYWSLEIRFVGLGKYSSRVRKISVVGVGKILRF